MNARSPTKMYRPMTESKYFRGSNFCLFATAAFLAWTPTLPLFTNGSIQSVIAQDDPIEPPPAETPRNPSAPPKPPPSTTPVTDPTPSEPS
ncbi:MAG: hypothetical protein EXS12_07190, partial [Phycisphaerales bacterium]|nr:hypothetical protein [Phycisphaerales bacterium]